MAEDAYDLVVIGAGPGGYQAAIRAAQLGMKTACIESRSTLGGTCLNVGCIPSKALLESSEAFAQASHKMGEMGVKVGEVSIDVKKMQSRKSAVVSSLTKGIAGLFKKNKITPIEGFASFTGPGTLSVKNATGKTTTVQGKSILIATGSEPIALPGVEFDEKQIVSSTGALDFSKVPKHLVVIGGGVIGLELGCVWARLGARVTVIEAMKTILPGMDGDVIRTIRKVIKKEGIEVHEETRFQKVEKKRSGLVIEASKGDESLKLEADKLLVCVGRRPFTAGLGLDKAGVELDEKGRIKVDGRFATSAAGVYAVGDVIEGPMLAHKAEEEGVACVEMLAGKAGHVNYEAIPGIVYCWPEIAAIGRTTEQCKAEGIDVRIGKIPFAANGRAKCAGETEGFVKIIADARTDRLLGAHIVGPNASELIGELALAFEYSASSEDIARSVHGHPTLSETIKEACLAVDKRSINF